MRAVCPRRPTNNHHTLAHKRMKRTIVTLCMALMATLSIVAAKKPKTQPLWPDGTVMDAWFADSSLVDISTLGRRYVVTDYGVVADTTRVQTEALQRVIDRCAAEGGGVVVVPRGTFVSGSLYFRQGTHLLVEEGGCLKGSDRIADFDIKTTRIEGETCAYYTALVNADGVDGFVISGPGTIDGNGHHYWRQFWMRRQWNPQCTNKDEQRPRLVYISHSQNVTVQNIRLQNSPFWTNHLYKSHHVRYLHARITSPTEGLKAPSSDAIDIDACHDVLVSGCYMSVNDDAVALKGGKGTWADRDTTNGPNSRIVIEHCRYGTVHGCLTLGSESIDDRNVVLRHCHADNANRVLWLKMRPDTPQRYAYVSVADITGHTRSFLVVRPWTQFFKPGDRADMPLSECSDISISRIRMQCDNFFDVGLSDKYRLCRFGFADIDVSNTRGTFDPTVIPETTVSKLRVNGTDL